MLRGREEIAGVHDVGDDEPGDYSDDQATRDQAAAADASTKRVLGCHVASPGSGSTADKAAGACDDQWPR